MRTSSGIFASAGARPYNFRVIHPDGSVRLLRSQSAIGLDDQGRPFRKFGTTQDITERNDREEALRQANAQLQTLSRRLMDAHESERRHLARELHDEIGQTLTAAKLNLKALLPEIPPLPPAGWGGASRRWTASLGRCGRFRSIYGRPCSTSWGLCPPSAGWRPSSRSRWGCG